ncbi:apoptosis inhibitor 5 [Schistocerca americana]|uniref:apoptosis inhibitor 5 n=1 Tax=Schistocerca americana TaxID=7009 RepID=UPI001F4F8F3C|nr:apoptosis inhibitor 5 [Schistocerca americana]XP_047120739.1 apoptosis inhibitor 5 [Schistocerca piceifrons]XP_049836763.1 apoptosis inhibitor 5 [Schistocerca gregaria]XP_049938236.1 apoptosis inhibitor 5 [Schistocerca serialis cubense]
MATDSIEKLYKNFGILADAKEKIGEHENEYLEILKAVKGSPKEKRLASQFIARFFKHFPALADKAIEAQLDLCEDEDIAIRKQAVKDLPNLCKDNNKHTRKIADILAQLLQVGDPTELSVVHNSLMTLFKMDAKGTLDGIFSQIFGENELGREKCIKFLNAKIKVLGRDVIDKEAEDILISECKKVLMQAVTEDEFRHIMELLGWSRLSQTVSGQQELVDLVAEQADIGQPFDPHDPEIENVVDRLIQCVRHALPYFSSQVDSSKFVTYFCEQVLRQFGEIVSNEDGVDSQLEILKLFAELCTHCGPLENAESKVDKVFQRLVEYMPLPPDTEVEGSTQEQPRLEFSYVECLMYGFHRLGRQCPEYLTKDLERLKDFRFRLQYFARGIQGYIKKLREALQGKSPEDLRSEENKIKVVALKTTSNINTLIKDLFHSPPSYKSDIILSWKPTNSSAAKESTSPGQKRHTPITFTSGDSSASKQPKTDKSPRELYQPPSGKYSNKVSSYTPTRGRGRGRGRGGFRGNRGWRRGF